MNLVPRALERMRIFSLRGQLPATAVAMRPPPGWALLRGTWDSPRPSVPAGAGGGSCLPPVKLSVGCPPPALLGCSGLSAEWGPTGTLLPRIREAGVGGEQDIREMGLDSPGGDSHQQGGNEPQAPVSEVTSGTGRGPVDLSCVPGTWANLLANLPTSALRLSAPSLLPWPSLPCPFPHCLRRKSSAALR